MANEPKVPQEIVELQPDALEIRNEKLPWALRMCIWLPLVLFALAITWACMAEVDVIIRGTGKLVTNTPTIVMKPLERSVIKQIDVEIGDVVKANQVLITFDPAYSQADVERLRNEKEALSAELARLRAEFQGKPYQGGEGQFEKWQLAIFEQRRDYYDERIRYFEEMQSQIAASTKGKQDSLRKQSERLEEFRRLEDMYKKLLEMNAATPRDLIENSINRMEMEGTVEQIENDILELKHRAGSNTADKNSFIQEWRNTISQKMVEADRNLTAITKEYDQAFFRNQYDCLKAPCDAVVLEIAAFSAGSAVREAEALITLIPIDGQIELEGEIRPQDIGQLSKGASVRVKLTAFPFQKHGTLDGIVRDISANTLERQEAGHPLAYYRVRIPLSGKLKGVPDDFRLMPGMEAQCDIKCGKRRAIEYLLYPFLRAIDEAAREP